jgi:hypothetical protein
MPRVATSWLFLCWLVVAASFVVGGVESAPIRGAELSKQQVQLLEEAVLPAFQQGDAVTVVWTMSPQIPRWTTAHFLAVDQWLAQRAAPRMRDVVGQARGRIAEQNLAVELPRPAARELAWTMGTVTTRVRDTLTRGTMLTAADGPLPNSLKLFEELFWKLHVLENELDNAQRLGEFGAQLRVQSARLSTRGLEADETQFLTTDFAKLQNDVKQLRDNLKQREAELRVDRLALADQVLTNSQDLKERFRAAFALDLDGYVLESALGWNQQKTAKLASDQQRSLSLNLSPDARAVLADRAQKHLAHGREIAGEEFIAKSRAFFTGLHWWLRGRYGSGPDGYGLLKHRAALASPQSQFALYMPAETPRPIHPLVQGQAVPLVDRRHHYLWQFETRDVVVNTSSQSSSSAISPASLSPTDVNALREALPAGIRAQAASVTMGNSFW